MNPLATLWRLPLQKGCDFEPEIQLRFEQPIHIHVTNLFQEGEGWVAECQDSIGNVYLSYLWDLYHDTPSPRSIVRMMDEIEELHNYEGKKLIWTPRSLWEKRKLPVPIS